MTRRRLLSVLALLLVTGATVATAGGLAAATGAGGATAVLAAARADGHGAPDRVSSSRCAAGRAAGRITFISPFKYDASAGIIDVFAAQHLGYFADECLDVSIAVNSENAPALVGAGKAQVTGEGSAADTLEADAAGAGLVGVSTFGDTSDYALLTPPAITNLRQLEDKTLAYHSVLPVILREMLVKAGVDMSKVHLVNDQVYVPSFDGGRIQALQAYQSNEPFTLETEHVAFKEWTPAQFGIKGTFNVQVVNAAFLHAHPVAVADFLRAELHAFDWCSAHAEACVAIERSAAGGAAAGYNTAHALQEWGYESKLAANHTLPGKGIGVESFAEWKPEAGALVHFHLLQRAPDLAKEEDPGLVASLYRGTSLIWPG